MCSIHYFLPRSAVNNQQLVPKARRGQKQLSCQKFNSLTLKCLPPNCNGRYHRGWNETLSAPACSSSSLKVHKHCTTGLHPNYLQRRESPLQRHQLQPSKSPQFPTLYRQPCDPPIHRSPPSQKGYTAQGYARNCWTTRARTWSWYLAGLTHIILTPNHQWFRINEVGSTKQYVFVGVMMVWIASIAWNYMSISWNYHCLCLLFTIHSRIHTHTQNTTKQHGTMTVHENPIF